MKIYLILKRGLFDTDIRSLNIEIATSIVLSKPVYLISNIPSTTQQFFAHIPVFVSTPLTVPFTRE